jgi:hypothetical protein
LDGTSNDALRAELDEHLLWCKDCKVVMNTTKKTIEIYRDNKLYELPESLRRRLQEAILSKCRGKRHEKKST